MSILKTYQFISGHPVTKHQKAKALSRWFRWQISSRLLGMPVVVPYVNQTRLIVKKGMTGATGNFYCGLHEFNDMAFVLHFLKGTDDLFVDIGANVGSYTILAAATGANVISLEPVRNTFEALLDNVHINRFQNQVLAINTAVGSSQGELLMTADKDTTNQAIKLEDTYQGLAEKVPVTNLDSLLKGKSIPALIKIDVEGFEGEVISGGYETFSNNQQLAVIMELNGSATRYGVNELDLHQKMLDFGYKSFCYDPIERNLTDLKGKNLESGNTLYLKKPNEVLSQLKGSPEYCVLDINI